MTRFVDSKSMLAFLLIALAMLGAPVAVAEGVYVDPDPVHSGPTSSSRTPTTVQDPAEPQLEPPDTTTNEEQAPPSSPEPAPREYVSPLPPITSPPEWPEVARAAGGVVADRQVIAYYGNPNSPLMGILGEKSIELMTSDLLARAAEYDDLNGDIGVAPAFHIIYGTVWENAEIGILNESRLLEYLEYAEENDIIVFLDHQIGKYSVEEAVTAMLPYLQYDHVHLAIDPEWATTIPGQEIGQIHADELNAVQQLMSDYMAANGIPGPRMLIVHQFNWRMIDDRHLVRSDYPGVHLIHNADGFGNPHDKLASWRFNVQAANMPLKGFKLFYPKSWRDGGYDDPLLTPAEVLRLDPVPVYIQYQ